jgi:hypothetical protein
MMIPIPITIDVQYTYVMLHLPITRGEFLPLRSFVSCITCINLMLSSCIK